MNRSTLMGIWLAAIGAGACGCSALWDSMARLDPAQAAEIGKVAGQVAGQSQPGLGIGPEIGATIGTVLALAVVYGLKQLGRMMGGKEAPKV